ncbi:Trehalase [Aphelenchoides besseyi]|nr:Trehalase [Aphelenchoides besseyi]
MKGLIVSLVFGLCAHFAHSSWTPYFTAERLEDTSDGMCLDIFPNRLRVILLDCSLPFFSTCFDVRKTVVEVVNLAHCEVNDKFYQFMTIRMSETCSNQNVLSHVPSRTKDSRDCWAPFYISLINGVLIELIKIVYCEGPLIEAVNMHRLYNDSKDYVDRPLRQDPKIIMDEFSKRFPSDIRKIDPDKLRAFVEEFFFPLTKELLPCTPTDWQEEPEKIMKIQDPELRAWALELNALWPTLCRIIDPKMLTVRDRHSILWVSHPFIVPGGRFREAYYWDAYWIIRGLLISGMTETAKLMVYNFATIIKDIGFIPNGLRVYYTNRSQPPMFTPMVYAIYQETQDMEFLTKMMPYMEIEFKFWEKNRKFAVVSESGVTHEVYFYRTRTSKPRPETMWADLSASEQLDEEDRPFFFQSAASAAESGWDFSSRWFSDPKSISTMETVVIAPVDLNSFMCRNMEILGYLNRIVGDTKKAVYFENMHEDFIWTHDSVFYSNDAGGWYDYNNRTKRHIVHNYGSVGVPLFTNCYSTLDQTKPRRLYDTLEVIRIFIKKLVDKAIIYDNKRHVRLGFAGGVPVSNVRNTKQQWDFPNGWAPLNHMFVEGLRQSADPIMQDRAFEIATKWIHGNYRVFNETKLMFEKYNVIGTSPSPGSGGEYAVQTGFGWSNGAILDLLYTYYDRMQAPDANNKGDGKKDDKGSLAIACNGSFALMVVMLSLLHSLFS